MYIFNTRKMINFSFLTFTVGLVVFVLTSSGIIKSSAQSNFNQQNPSATLIVNNNGDTVDALSGDGVCSDAFGNCTLRAAIQTANELSDADVINFSLPAPTSILLTRGRLIITNDLTITAPTSANLTINFGNVFGSYFLISENTTVVTFNRITVTNGLGSSGGGIFNLGKLNLNDVIVTNNRSNEGGGIWSAGVLTITDSTISNNKADNQNGTPGSVGGGLLIQGTATIIRSTISGNQSYSGTGITVKDSGSVTIINSTISGNSALSNGIGGAIRAVGSTSDLTRVTLSLSNTTIANNTASTSAIVGGIYNSNSTIGIHNSIVANNTGNGDIYGSFKSLGNNIIGNPGAATGFINNVNGDKVGVNPLLAPLADNGGATWTHALLAGSPAINAGNNVDAPPTDQRGFARIVGGTIDIGAFEVQTVTCDFTINPTNQAIGSSGGDVNVNITGVNGCSRTAVSNANWITVTSGGSGSGSGTVTLSVQANTGSARTGTVTIAGQPFTVTQASGCTFTLSPTSAAISGFAGTSSFNITASAPDCSYSAASNNSFITITAGANGTGNGTVSYSVAANSGTARTGTITVGGQTFTISQAAIPNLSINNVSKNEGSSGTTAFDFTVNLSTTSAQIVTVNYATTNGTATAGEDYQAKNSLLTFAPGETSKTIAILVNGDVKIEPDETFTINLTNPTNATIASGTGTGTILNDDSCSYTISPANLSVDAAGGNSSLIVTTQAGCTYSAETSDSFIIITSGANGNGTGTINFSVAANTGAARTGRIFLAGQVVTITQAAATIVTQKTKFDFDGDGKADLSVFRPDNGVWYLQQSTNGFTGAQFGVSTDKLVPADYDGDGKTDLAVYRSGIWYLMRSSAGFAAFSFGDSNDIPQPADFDGDGKADLAVWRPSNGTWYVMNLATNSFSSAQFGASTDKPVIGDYNGDGKADLAVWRPSNGFWYIARPSGVPSQNFDSIQLGVSTDKPVPADYDGDGKTDIAVYRPSNGVWYLQRSTSGFLGIQFGIATDLPVAADYDGDGKADIAVYRDGNWYLNRTTAGFLGIQFGAPTDKPAPNAFVP